MHSTLEDLIAAAYALPDGETLVVTEEELADLGGPSTDSDEGTLNDTTYHHTDDGRAWITRPAKPGYFYAWLSDHPSTRQHAAILVREAS